jgi:hypothetical protein
LVLNQGRARHPALEQALLAIYGKIDAFLREHAPDGTWLFEDFGLAEAVYAPRKGPSNCPKPPLTNLHPEVRSVVSALGRVADRAEASSRPSTLLEPQLRSRVSTGQAALRPGR